MADRIVVMNQGVIEQVGTPMEVYRDPTSPFVADFVGKINVLAGRLHPGQACAKHIRPAFHNVPAQLFYLPETRLPGRAAPFLSQMRCGADRQEAKPTKENPMSDLSQAVFFTPKTVTLSDEERQPCEIWTRVMGYHRPVASFNIGKQGEHSERRFFAEQRCAA